MKDQYLVGECNYDNYASALKSLPPLPEGEEYLDLIPAAKAVIEMVVKPHLLSMMAQAIIVTRLRLAIENHEQKENQTVMNASNAKKLAARLASEALKGTRKSLIDRSGTKANDRKILETALDDIISDLVTRGSSKAENLGE